MNNTLLNSLQLKGFLSFSPKSEPVALTSLNVLVGPNGVGKSNFIEAIELLHATPADFSGVIRLGGTPNDWIWHGGKGATAARIEALLSAVNSTPELHPLACDPLRRTPASLRRFHRCSEKGHGTRSGARIPEDSRRGEATGEGEPCRSAHPLQVVRATLPGVGQSDRSQDVRDATTLVDAK